MNFMMMKNFRKGGIILKQHISIECLNQLSEEQKEKYVQCQSCGIYFYVHKYRRKTAKYCSMNCLHNREITKEQRMNYSKAQLLRDKSTFNKKGLDIGREVLKDNNYTQLKGKNNSRWSGWIKISPQGYVYVWAPDHPNNSHNYVALHRLIVEHYIGRYLTTDEVVHHKNKDKSDNRIENLEVLSQSEHTKRHCYEMLNKRNNKTG